MSAKAWGAVVLAALFLAAGTPPAWAKHKVKSLPTAKQDGLLEQALHVVFVPVDIAGALLYAEGETYSKGQAYRGHYARHGYYRSHARWWDTFLYHHGK